jgi:drug/metabolite transporter (DMT)-like permease
MTHHWGYLGAITSALLFGISTTFNKIALENVSPLIIAGMIYFIGGVVLIAFRLSPLNKRIQQLFETSTQTEEKITRRDYQVLVYVIICGSIVAPLLLVYGLNQTTAVNASLLLNAEVLFTVAIALLFLRERGTIKDYLAIGVIVLGVVFLTTNGQFQNIGITGLSGNLLIICACLFWGIDNNLSKQLSKKRDILVVTGLKCFVGGTALLLLALIIGVNLYFPLSALPYVLSVGAFSIALSIFFFTFALREIGAMRTGVIFSTSSLFGAVLAFLVLKEAFTIFQLFAGLIIISGVFLLYRE